MDKNSSISEEKDILKIHAIHTNNSLFILKKV